MIIKITEEDFVKAKLVASEYEKHKTGLNSRIVATKDHDLVGYLGQIAFEKYLISKGIAYSKPDETIERHRRDKYDFLVGGYRIDVKSTKVFDTVVINQNKLRKARENNTNILVSVKISIHDKVADIQGYCLLSEMKEAPELYWKRDKLKMYKPDSLRQFKSQI